MESREAAQRDVLSCFAAQVEGSQAIGGEAGGSRPFDVGELAKPVDVRRRARQRHSLDDQDAGRSLDRLIGVVQDDGGEAGQQGRFPDHAGGEERRWQSGISGECDLNDV